MASPLTIPQIRNIVRVSISQMTNDLSVGDISPGMKLKDVEVDSSDLVDELKSRITKSVRQDQNGVLNVPKFRRALTFDSTSAVDDVVFQVRDGLAIAFTPNA